MRISTGGILGRTVGAGSLLRSLRFYQNPQCESRSNALTEFTGDPKPPANRPGHGGATFPHSLRARKQRNTSNTLRKSLWPCWSELLRLVVMLPGGGALYSTCSAGALQPWWPPTACNIHFGKPHLEVDHIIARSKGGTDHPENLQLLCSHCNNVKGDHGMECLKAQLQMR